MSSHVGSQVLPESNEEVFQEMLDRIPGICNLTGKARYKKKSALPEEKKIEIFFVSDDIRLSPKLQTIMAREIALSRIK